MPAPARTLVLLNSRYPVQRHTIPLWPASYFRHLRNATMKLKHSTALAMACLHCRLGREQGHRATADADAGSSAADVTHAAVVRRAHGNHEEPAGPEHGQHQQGHVCNFQYSEWSAKTAERQRRACRPALRSNSISE